MPMARWMTQPRRNCAAEATSWEQPAVIGASSCHRRSMVQPFLRLPIAKLLLSRSLGAFTCSRIGPELNR